MTRKQSPLSITCPICGERSRITQTAGTIRRRQCLTLEGHVFFTDGTELTTREVFNAEVSEDKARRKAAADPDFKFRAEQRAVKAAILESRVAASLARKAARVEQAAAHKARVAESAELAALSADLLSGSSRSPEEVGQLERQIEDLERPVTAPRTRTGHYYWHTGQGIQYRTERQFMPVTIVPCPIGIAQDLGPFFHQTVIDIESETNGPESRL